MGFDVFGPVTFALWINTSLIVQSPLLLAKINIG